MSRIVVGVDVGGSGIAAVACDDDGIEKYAQGDPSNLRLVGVDAAAASIAEVVRRVCAPAAPSALFVGAAGAGDGSVTRALQRALEIHFADTPVGASDDAHIALRAELPQGDGIALIAGTGSIAYAEISERHYRVGGYGHLLGDEGSGYAIGSAAARALLRAYDGRAPFDPMLEEVARSLDSACAVDVVARTYASPHAVRDLAALATIVLTHADSGERSAAKIIQTAALELFDVLKALSRKASIHQEALPLVFAGGLLRQNSLLTYLLETRISHEFPHLEVRKNVPAPKYGALACARQLLAK